MRVCISSHDNKRRLTPKVLSLATSAALGTHSLSLSLSLSRTPFTSSIYLLQTQRRKRTTRTLAHTHSHKHNQLSLSLYLSRCLLYNIYHPRLLFFLFKRGVYSSVMIIDDKQNSRPRIPIVREREREIARNRSE